jgi:hypothetical protein
VQRKAEGGEKGGHEVSSPDEPAEKEADAVSEKVANGLHGDKGSKEGAPKVAAKLEGVGRKVYADKGEAKEKPVEISAQLEGVGRKVYAAKKKKKDAPAAAGGASAAGAAPGADAKPDATKVTSATKDAKGDPPAAPTTAYAKAYASFLSGWPNFCKVLKDHGIEEDKISALEGKREGWFKDLVEACTHKKGVDAVRDKIFAQIPKKGSKPKKDKGHLYSGRIGGSKAKVTAETAAGAEGGRTLEKTHIGALFDNVDWGGLLDWDSQALLWWKSISAQYAKSLKGKVTVHLAIDFNYNASQGRDPMKVDRGSVFAGTELQNVLNQMKLTPPGGREHIVTEIHFDVQFAGNVKTKKGDKPVSGSCKPTVKAPGPADAESVLVDVDKAIAAAAKKAAK